MEKITYIYKHWQFMLPVVNIKQAMRYVYTK